MSLFFGSNISDIQIKIGPAIDKCCYEVSDIVKDAFKKFPVAWESISEQLEEEGKWKLSLKEANRLLLIKHGVLEENIEVSNLCTCCTKELFFSYRRDVETGRQLGFISLKK